MIEQFRPSQMRRLVATQSNLGHQKATFHQMKTKAWILHVLLNHKMILWGHCFAKLHLVFGYHIVQKQREKKRKTIPKKRQSL